MTLSNPATASAWHKAAGLVIINAAILRPAMTARNGGQ